MSILHMDINWIWTSIQRIYRAQWIWTVILSIYTRKPLGTLNRHIITGHLNQEYASRLLNRVQRKMTMESKIWNLKDHIKPEAIRSVMCWLKSNNSTATKADWWNKAINQSQQIQICQRPTNTTSEIENWRKNFGFQGCDLTPHAPFFLSHALMEEWTNPLEKYPSWSIDPHSLVPE